MKRKIVGLILTLFWLSLLGGCIPSVELTQRAIVQAIGVDTAGEKYRVTLQIFFPEGGDSGIDAGKQNAKVISVEGETISDAIQVATLQQGKKIFYGHNRLLIIGEETAKNGIREILPFFNNAYQTRPSTDVMIAEGTAEEILTANIKQGIVPAESIQKMIENHSENASVVQARLLDVIEAIYDESKSVAVPKIKLTEEAKETANQGGEEEESVEPTHLMTIDGTAVLKAEKLIGYLDTPQTRGLVWLTGKVKRTFVVFPYRTDKNSEEQMVSIEIYQSDTHTKVTMAGGKPVFSVQIKAKGRGNEVSLSDQLSGTEETKKLETQASTAIQKECEASFLKSATEYRADLFSYGNLLLRTEKEAWKGIKPSWPDRIADARLQVQVAVSIDRLGLQADSQKQ